MPVPEELKVAAQFSAKCSQKCVQICLLVRDALALHNHKWYDTK